uniref:Ubiquitin-like protein ATG12 n=1 Tax=Steinernema glaseri TaxID=37863 RepID=A0A1I7Y6B2_9BILA
MSDSATPPKTASPPLTPATPTSPAPSLVEAEKITIMMKAIGGGDTPIMKKNTWSVEPTKKISELVLFVRKYLNLTDNTNFFFFVNDSFVPHPDHNVGNLYTCFAGGCKTAKGAPKLILQYSVTPTYG